MEVKTRFAPSPTGVPHIGNIRTALFSYFLARANSGKFLLRIEDTDQARKMDGAIEAIKESLSWIGADWDEVIIQSERLDSYRKYVDQLIEKGVAKEEEGAVRFITPKEGETSWVDGLGNKKITFQNSQVEDFIILKSDGYPTYHLANVIDDHLTKITHVIRGEDWIPSTPKHILLYQTFGWLIPTFVHVPNIVGTDGKKLSKRFGAKNALEFKQDGYFPEALLNYLVLLGWSPKNNREILTKEEITKLFSLDKLNSSPAVFDQNKLDWMNGEYIRQMSDEQLVKRLEQYLADLSQGAIHPAVSKLKEVAPLIKERIKKLSDFVPLTDFLFESPEYEQHIFKDVTKKDLGEVKEIVREIKKSLEGLEKPWTAEKFEKTFREFAQEHSLSPTVTFQLIRVVISGQTVTPPLFESIKILGEEETLKRFEQSLSQL